MVKKDKRNNTWMFEGKYKNHKGKYKGYRRTGYKTKREALDAESVFLSSINEYDDSETLNDIVNIYHQRSNLMNVKESTIIGDESYYNNHLKYYFGEMKCKDISPKIIELWKVEMVSKKQNNGRLYSPSTINHAKNVLSKYLSYAVSIGVIEYNPVKSVRAVSNKHKIDNNDKNKFWELDEFKKFIESVDEPYWNDVFTFLFQTGLREGEMFALQWSDIDFKRGKIDIKKSITNKTLSDHYELTTPKTKNSYRKIDITNTIEKILKRKYNESKDIDGFNNEWFVFGSSYPLSRSHLARNLDKYINISGVKRITPHGFRHSHASILIHNKIDDSLIAERLGHTVNELRKTYAHIYTEMRDDMKDKLNKIF